MQKNSKVVEETATLRDRFEETSEKALFGARWLLAPFYFGLTGAIALLAAKFVQEFYTFARSIFISDTHTVQLGILGLLDLTLLGNLMLIMIFAGYENFVSKIGAAEASEDRPHWMGRVDYSGLKIKLIGSLVAISVIELLKDFMNLDHSGVTPGIKWRILIHLTFVLSGVLFALMDFIVEKREQIDIRILREDEKK
jgi:uncharacterized protein (TIGR00645 family)